MEDFYPRSEMRSDETSLLSAAALRADVSSQPNAASKPEISKPEFPSNGVMDFTPIQEYDSGSKTQNKSDQPDETVVVGLALPRKEQYTQTYKYEKDSTTVKRTGELPENDYTMKVAVDGSFEKSYTDGRTISGRKYADGSEVFTGSGSRADEHFTAKTSKDGSLEVSFKDGRKLHYTFDQHQNIIAVKASQIRETISHAMQTEILGVTPQWALFSTH